MQTLKVGDFMFDLSTEHSVRGFTKFDYIFIADYLHLIKDNYLLIEKDVVLNTHFSGLINRLYELADIPDPMGNVESEFYIAVVEYPDT